VRAIKDDPRKNCAWCDKPLTRKRFSTGRLEDRGRFLKRKFCDKECQRNAQVNPTTTNKQTMLARSAKFRKAACERCGVTERLHVHHRDQDRTNNDPSNLETLCVLCHNRHHFRLAP
jgi:hypothetical protein